MLRAEASGERTRDGGTRRVMREDKKGGGWDREREDRDGRRGGEQ